VAIWLEQLGAHVAGYSLEPPSQPNLFEVAKIGIVLTKRCHVDVRDLAALQAAVSHFEPDIFFISLRNRLCNRSRANRRASTDAATHILIPVSKTVHKPSSP
jgi:CDP-glucose 4,6-dehydratase